MHLLPGLPLEYDDVITYINSHQLPLEIEEVHAMLMSQEMRLQQAIPSVQPAANTVNREAKKRISTLLTVVDFLRIIVEVKDVGATLAHEFVKDRDKLFPIAIINLTLPYIAYLA